MHFTENRDIDKKLPLHCSVLQWVDHGWLPSAHPATLSLLLLSQTREQRLKADGLVREISHQLLSQAKEIKIEEE